MGINSKRPLLPAPTESLVDDGGVVRPEESSTELSTRSDITSYSIPETGEPIKISTKKLRAGPSGSGASQTSLLIEYFEGGRSGNSSNSRPSVRVKVTPSGKRMKDGDSVHITEVGKDRQPSSTRRINLGDPSSSRAVEATEFSRSAGFNASGRPPIEVEVLNNASNISSNLSRTREMPTTSDVSSMPADNMAEPVKFQTPVSRSRGKSVAEVEERGLDEQEESGPVKLLSRRRSRSLSRERIAKRAAEKVAAIEGMEAADAAHERRKLRKSRPKSGSKEIYEEGGHTRSRRSSKSSGAQRDSGDFKSGTGTESSSYLRPKEAESNLSTLSRSSLANNPKLLQTVEDAIRRMILPEINEIKRQQSVHQSKSNKRDSKDSYFTEESQRTDLDRPFSKSSSAPETRTRDRVDREIERDGVKHRKVRRSNKDGETERRSHRSSREVETERKSSKTHNSDRYSRDAEGLSSAALKDHDRQERDLERRERRKQRSKSRSGTDSLARTDEEYYGNSEPAPKDIPPMPMRSEMDDSDLTRESIMSASEAEPNIERPESHQSLKTVRAEKEVSRDGPSEIPLLETRTNARSPAADLGPRTPRAVRSREERSLKSSTSAKSISTKAREAGLLAAAGLGGAAGALYGQNRRKSDRSRSRNEDRPPLVYEREASPVRSEGNIRRDGVFAENFDRPLTALTAGGEREKAVEHSVISGSSTSSTQYPLTQKRHTGINLEQDPNCLPRGTSPGQQLHQRETEQSRDLKPTVETDRNTQSFEDDADKHAMEDDSLDSPPGNTFLAQRVKHISGNPELLSTPIHAQSETASLLNPSNVSSGHDEEAPDEPTTQSFSPHSYRERDLADNGGAIPVMLNADENASRDRWMLLRDRAKALSSSNNSLSTQGDANTMRASSNPKPQGVGPETGDKIHDDELASRSLREKQSSVLEGPLGDENEDRSHWPYDATPDFSKRPGYVDDHPDERYISDGNAALMGAAAGLGVGAGAVAAARGMDQGGQQQAREPSIRTQSSASRDERFERRITLEAEPTRDANSRDEGYNSAAHAQDNGTPLSFSKPPPALFDETDRGFNPAAGQADPFTTRGPRAKHFSGNSHGMSAGYYDAATGKGINNIQSQDIVALMDHLSVRDGRRSARDSEIIMTLVRSAVESRNNFEDVKKLIESQGHVTRGHQDKGHDVLLSKILSNGPRPQVLGSPRGPASADGTPPMPVKKQNIFKRAMKGLGSKSSNDVTRIEDMIVQLLGEIESLKASQVNISQQPLPTVTTRASIDTYGAQQAPESGYEPEGQAGTGSTPNRSGYFSPEARKSQPRMRSGYENNRASTNRVSTVFEGDEELDQDDINLITTSAQDAQRQRQAPFGSMQMRGIDAINPDNSPNMAVSSEERRKSEKRASMPRVSRWSKTTSSSGAENRMSTDTNPWGNRPISFESQSGEAINVLPPDGEPWIRSEDDRLPSPDSVGHQEDDRAVSPFIPGQHDFGPDFDEAKYQANRNSLTLQHPQPRAGPTGRHQNNLESQAYDFGGDDESVNSATPDNELFGSVPALARFPAKGFAPTRLSGVHNGPLSPPTSSQGDPNSPRTYYSQARQQPQPGPARPPKIRDDGPVVPPKVPLSHQMDSNSDAYSSSTSQVTITTEEASDDDEGRGSPEYSLNALERKRSPYMPGGPLAPIEERYSMEGDRSSLAYSLSQRSKRESLVDSVAGQGGLSGGYGSQSHSRRGSVNQGQHLEQVEEGDERSTTPKLNPRPAIGAVEKGGDVRRLTGPREMPTGGAGANAGGLKGTIRRKPLYGEA